MNKFLKTTVAGVAILGCATGLVGCGDGKTGNSIEPSKAFDTVYETMGTTLGKFTSGYGEASVDEIENMLTIDLDFGYSKKIVNPDASTETKIAYDEDAVNFGLKAILQSSFGGDSNKISGLLGLKDEDDLKTLLSMYVYDEARTDEDYTLITSEEEFNNASMFVYKKVENTDGTNSFVELTEDDVWAENTYYTVVSDTFVAYLSSQLQNLGGFEMLKGSAPADWGTSGKYYYLDDDGVFQPVDSGTAYEANKYYERTGVDIRYDLNEILASMDIEIPENVLNALYSGKIAIDCDYVELLNTFAGMLGDGDGSVAPPTDDPATELPTTEDETGYATLMGVFETLGDLDFETFKALLTDDETGICPFEFSGKQENGKTTFTIKYVEEASEEGASVYEGVTISFIADKNGSFEIAFKYEMNSKALGLLASEMIVEFSIKVEYKQNFDEQYVPSADELEKYGTPIDLNETIQGWIQGGEEDPVPVPDIAIN